ncbi:MAG: hypothetical protein A2289_19605 [Deltaproteobacteria bacterium RIFOXYA12_FULL_58_15]|nr:MAG: hypothetical protein A2289_19605 [Deltaproteobacteria bacterium RIFOXYA12_FULL_58_15]OGR15295.1 MAG: hypothetical protein A2341_09945 [Deltaproteobacteria bacterium RIFOXYB12_FULL_58_9]
MKKLITGMMLLALASFPAMAQAEGALGRTESDRAAEEQVAQPAPSEGTSSEAADYAEREATTPQLGEFQGGDRGYYIGGGVLTVVLIVVLVVILL